MSTVAEERAKARVADLASKKASVVDDEGEDELVSDDEGGTSHVESVDPARVIRVRAPASHQQEAKGSGKGKGKGKAPQQHPDMGLPVRCDSFSCPICVLTFLSAEARWAQVCWEVE